ncbi:protein-L-isoaspartate O-methyltransferase [candidate division KSB3 bacterium]|uniref:Protein-L-isoaspartate O-methyltransferase n=1 Tax=candidate division KSB3 bacterium TaxID=2044937 RepID=A0A2G6KHJ4_9BACT|nr:MAG: protein-L-isoaspartate O-methyltransferase [candidate division KSB3 bacterium]
MKDTIQSLPSVHSLPIIIRLLLLASILLPITSSAQGISSYTERRQHLVERSIKANGINDTNVLRAMSTVQRHEFVPEELREHAYQDRPLPIGLGQTISQPYLVAYMTELLKVNNDSVVLEVGTGSGYQAAVLAEIVKHVYTVEIFEELGELAQERFKRLEYENITADVGDGYYGWNDFAPFDGIVVTCAADHIPPPLIQQLKPGGRMVIPVGGVFQVQMLMLVLKDKNGQVTVKNMLPVRFVPLLGEHKE